MFGQRSTELLAVWGPAIQEVLNQCSPKIFGKSPTLDLPAASRYNDEKMGHAVVMIKGKKRALGCLWNRNVTVGYARITGGTFVDVQLFDYNITRFFSEVARARTYYPAAEDMKEQLRGALAQKKLLKHDM